jgi:uncharacterized protein (DUF952 family)
VAALSRILLHITTLTDWSAGARAGTYGGERLGADGFLHLSTPEQVAGPANALFSGHHDAWLLVIDEARLPVPVRWEAGDPPAADGAEFPHLYAPLPANAVIAAVPYPPGPDGTFGPPVGLPQPEDHLQRAYALEWYLARARATRVGALDPAYARRHHEYAVASQDNRLVLRREHSPAEAAALCEIELPGVDHWQVSVAGPLSAALVSAYESAGWSHTESLIMIASAVPTRLADPAVHVVEDAAAATSDQEEAWHDDIPRLLDPELREIVELEAATPAVAQSHHLAVLDDDGEPAAWADLYAAGATAQLENVMARPDRRGRGLATAVALDAVDRAHQLGCDVVFLRTDADDWPRHLYTQLGFRAMEVAHVFDFDPPPIHDRTQAHPSG